MCFWIKFQENEKTFREVPVHANTVEKAKDIFKHDFPGVNNFELITY
jgi:hypothetical protein